MKKHLLGVMLLVAVLCVLVAACAPAGSNEVTPTRSTVSEAPENSPASSPDISSITPGSFSGGYSGGEYWGFKGYDQPASVGKVMDDYIQLKLSPFAKVGYNISLVLDKDLAAYDGTAEDYFSEQVDGLQELPKLIYILYIGELNQAAVFTGDDVPEIDVDAVISAFQDESVTEPALRVMTAIKLLADEILAAEMTVS